MSSTVTRKPQPKPSLRKSRLLGSPPAPLRMRVLGGEHDGRLIEIASPKCTIGSARGCTLRLRASGVRPLHCWILRGKGGTLVRRYAPDAQLNGRGFIDRFLTAGDTLQVGPIRLNILECPAAAAEEPEAESVVASAEFRLLEHSTQESAASLARARDEIHELERRFSSQLDEAEALHAQVVAERDALQQEFDRQLQQFAEFDGQSTARERQVAGELEATNCQLAEARQQLEALQQQQAAELERQSEIERLAKELETARYAAATAESAVQQYQREQQAWKTHRERLEGDCRTLGHQLVERQKQLDESRERLSADAGQMTISMGQMQHDLEERFSTQQQERSAWTAEKQSLQLQIETLHQTLAEVKTELEAARSAQQAAEQARSAESTSAEPRIDGESLAQERELLETAQQQLERQRQELLVERESLAAAHEQCKRSADELQARLDEQEENLRAKERVLNQQAEELSERLDAATARAKELEQSQEEMARLRDELAKLQEQRSQEASEFASQQDAIAAAQRELEEERRVLQTAQESGRHAVHDTSDITPSVEGAAAESPASPIQDADVDSVLSRLVKAGVWRGEDESSEPRPGMTIPVQIAPVAPVDVQQTMILPAGAAPVEPSSIPEVERHDAPSAAAEKKSGGEDESIESYMERLLMRVRGDGVAGSQSVMPVAPVAPPAPVAAAEVVAQPVAVAEPMQPEEYIPRSPAPEQSNLAAMRELANSAARSAIQNHARTSGGKMAIRRLVGAVVTVLTSIFLGFWAIRAGSWAAGLGAAIGFSIGGHWCLLAAFKALPMFRREKPANVPAAVEPGPVIVEEPAAAGEIAEVSEEPALELVEVEKEPS